MNAEVQSFLGLLTKTFEKGAWHGPTVKETLDGLTANDAFNRLPNTHSIIELVGHMTAWRKYVTRKLNGDVNYKVTDDLNFPKIESWDQALRDLNQSQVELIAAIESFTSENLSEQVPWTNEPFSHYTILHGIIHHDLYHIGQINLIKKATVPQPL